MKILAAITLFGTLTAFTPNTKAPEMKKTAEDANITAYRATDNMGTPATTDDVHAYFNTLACINAFLATHPTYAKNGKVSVPEDQVLMCI